MSHERPAGKMAWEQAVDAPYLRHAERPPAVLDRDDMVLLYIKVLQIYITALLEDLAAELAPWTRQC